MEKVQESTVVVFKFARFKYGQLQHVEILLEEVY